MNQELDDLLSRLVNAARQDRDDEEMRRDIHNLFENKLEIKWVQTKNGQAYNAYIGVCRVATIYWDIFCARSAPEKYTYSIELPGLKCSFPPHGRSFEELRPKVEEEIRNWFIKAGAIEK